MKGRRGGYPFGKRPLDTSTTRMPPIGVQSVEGISIQVMHGFIEEQACVLPYSRSEAGVRRCVRGNGCTQAPQPSKKLRLGPASESARWLSIRVRQCESLRMVELERGTAGREYQMATRIMQALV
jgi:hypothetical protein